MEVASAVKLINSLVYKPGWEFTAQDFTNRFEGAVRVRIDYPARDSGREQASSGYGEKISTHAVFACVIADCDDVSVYRHVLNMIVDIETHEAREFLRVKPTMWAPFHPHRIDGMRRFGDVRGDLQFGIA